MDMEEWGGGEGKGFCYFIGRENSVTVLAGY